MCMSCGCKMYEDNMGEPATITKQSFEAAAKAMGQKPEEAMEETHKAIHELLGQPDHGPHQH